MTRVFRGGGGTVIKNKRDGYIPTISFIAVSNKFIYDHFP